MIRARFVTRYVLVGALALVLADAFCTTVYAQMPLGDPAEERDIRIARVKYGGGGDWYADPSSIPNWRRNACSTRSAPFT